MPAAALALALAAAVLHAAWNALAKRAADHTVFMWLVFAVAGAVQAIPLAVWLLHDGMAAAALPFVGASIAVHLAYIFLLGKSYKHWDYSLAYPVLRGLGVALVPAGAAWAYGEMLQPLGIAGIWLVVAGIVLIGLTAAGWRTASPVRWRSAVWPLLTGVSVAGYSVIDSGGVKLLHPLPYIASFMVGSSILLLPVLAANRRRVASEWSLNWKPLLACAILSIAGFLLVLYAFRLAPAGYVVATRETSVVFSVLIGGLLLREQNMKLRLAAATLILAGVAIIALRG